MPTGSRLEPTVFLAMISPVTVGLVAGTVALVLLVGGPWWVAVIAAAVVWIVRVAIATRVARRVATLPRRIDPFALREPWRFFVRDAIQAQRRFADAVELVAPGPLRDRLADIGDRVVRGVDESWQIAQRGQHLTDTRRAIDIERIERTLGDDAVATDDPRRASASVQKQSHDRLRSLEDDTRARLEILDARLEEAVVRAAELTTRSSGDPAQLDSVADAVDGVVGDLEALRLGLESADGSGG